MENREIASLLAETADLMEIAAEDGFRIRSYRNAATSIEGYPERIADIAANPEQAYGRTRHRQGHRWSYKRSSGAGYFQQTR